jgi:UDP-N-acetylglucosamine--N-acetylmuramyl-(pentapeptide) pyrophosphoryl-undecaprenol N-acetylglucosamine transferase
MPKTSNPTLIFTGGHHSSSLAVAESLKSLGWTIVWLGHKHTMWKDASLSAEFQEVVAAKIQFIDLKAGKFYHNFDLQKLIRIPYGFIQAFLILAKLKIRYKKNSLGIVSFGGYLGVPVVVCGWLLGIPSISHEQTTTTGWANSLISFFAKKVAISWPSSLSHFSKHKVVLTGLPLRPEICRSKLNTPTPNQVYITGGKQGSHIINETIFSLLPTLLEDYQLIHQTGSTTVFSDYDKAINLKQSLPMHLKDKYKVYKYLSPDQTAHALSTSTIVISRSGAHITYELAYLQTRCVLIPLPNSSHNEQFKNAQVLKDVHQAIVIPQDHLTPQALLASIKLAQQLKPTGISIVENGLELMVQLIIQTFSK